MMSPDASDLAWIFVVTPRVSDRAPEFPAPVGAGGRHVRANDGGIEHLDQMRRRTHGSERIKEGLEHAPLAQAVEPFPDAVPSCRTVPAGRAIARFRR